MSSTDDWLELVRNKARDVRFGVIQITIHDARVVQVECTEKTRLDARAVSPPSAPASTRIASTASKLAG